MKLRTLKCAIILFALFDLLGGYGGFLSLTNMAAAQTDQRGPTKAFYSALDYQYETQIYSGGSTAGGAYAIVVMMPSVVSSNGRQFNPFATTIPIAVGNGANAEVVTPSTVSGCGNNGTLFTCTITATFSNGHGQGDLVKSGDFGILEAIADAAAAGGGMVLWQIDGTTTLATGSANTNLSSQIVSGGTTVNIPVHSVVMGAAGRVTTTIGTCAGGWSLGYSTGVEFTPANTNLTAGQTSDTTATLANLYAVAYNAAAGPVIIHCTTSNASAGALHARVWGYKMVSPGF